ncbi:IS3 family transposase [Lysinibacillus pakistanensis]|uniref:IS3 family transposase n=1 Tax=Lysinibacillus pakistanensis TaxID=759811 RepID=UPI0033356C2B
MCRVLKVPKSTYYQSFHKKPSVYEVENKKITGRICAIHKESDGRYGASKIHAQLLKEGVKVSIKRVQKLQYLSFYACSLPIYDSRNIMLTLEPQAFVSYLHFYIQQFSPLGSITYLRTWFTDLTYFIVYQLVIKWNYFMSYFHSCGC